MAQLFAGLDVSDKTTAICVVNKHGETVWEGSANTDPQALIVALKPYKSLLQAVGLEAGVKAAWLQRGLSSKRYPIVCLDTRHTHAALSARRNKSDVGDAHGIALLLCQGIFATSYVKSQDALYARLLLNNRKVLQSKAHDLHVTLRMTLKQFGAAMRRDGDRLVYDESTKRPDRNLGALAEPIIRAHGQLMAEYNALNQRVHSEANNDAVCRRLMTIPGVGPITALAFKAAVDDPTRFTSSRDLAAYFGLTPTRFQSGGVDVMRKISKRGDKSMRSLLYDAAHTLLVVCRTNAPLRVWALDLAKRKGAKLAKVATARKLCVIMHRMWVTGRDFDASPTT
ncbi:MAG: IS110 family transposase [Vitreimonas sp.]